MIPRHLGDITSSDIQALLDNAVPEGNTLEYKCQLPDETDKMKIKFLASVSAFANASGGDIVYGIDERNGSPIRIPGINHEDIDSQILRLDNTVRNGIEPRIPDCQIKPVKFADGRQVIVLRIGRSWAAPHRVTYKDHSKFYSRNSAGKYPLDVNELRAAFTFSEMLVERIRSFREGRVTALITRHELPVALASGGMIALHVAPLIAFSNQRANLIAPTSDHVNLLPPINAIGLTHRVNLDGLVTYENTDRTPTTYVQLFRSGVIESVNVRRHSSGRRLLPNKGYEKEIIEHSGKYLAALRSFGINGPAYIFISLVGMKGFKFDLDPRFFSNNQELDRDLVLIPEVAVDVTELDPSGALRPAFDIVWNAFGYDQCRNYNAEGKWQA